MKKAYIRTEIIKYLNTVEKENGNPLSVPDVFNLLPKLYEHLKSDPEIDFSGLDFQQFQEQAKFGYILGQQKAQFGF